MELEGDVTNHIVRPKKSLGGYMHNKIVSMAQQAFNFSKFGKMEVLYIDFIIRLLMLVLIPRY